MAANVTDAVEALVAECASAQVTVEWRCAVCGCDRVEAGRRADRRGRALHRNAVTCGSAECNRERERRQLREKYGPGSAYYAAVQRKRRRRQRGPG